MATLTETDVVDVVIHVRGETTPPRVIVEGQSVDASGAVIRRAATGDIWAVLPAAVQSRIQTLLANAKDKLKGDLGIA